MSREEVYGKHGYVCIRPLSSLAFSLAPTSSLSFSLAHTSALSLSLKPGHLHVKYRQEIAVVNAACVVGIEKLYDGACLALSHGHIAPLHNS